MKTAFVLLYRVLFIAVAFLPSWSAYAIDCKTNCSDVAKEEWTCGVKCKKWKCRPAKCSAINPLRLASCESIKATACAADAVDRGVEWIDDRWGSDNGLGPKVASSTERFFKWSPSLVSASKCTDTDLAVTWSWDSYGGSNQGGSIDNPNNTDHEQKHANFLISLGCGIDTLVDSHRTSGLMVCEDKQLAQDIEDERFGAYYLQKSPSHVCKMKYRHLKNGPANLYDRSRNISACVLRFGTTKALYGREMTFDCHDMQPEMVATLAEAQAATAGDYEDYKQKYKDLFEDLFEDIDLLAFSDVKAVSDELGGAVHILAESESENKRLVDENTALLAKKAELESLQKQIEGDREKLQGALEMHQKLRMEFLGRFKEQAAVLKDKIASLHSALNSRVKLASKLQAWVNGVVGLPAGDGDLSTDIVQFATQRNALKSDDYKKLCEDASFKSTLADTQSYYVALESQVDSYIFQVNRLEIPQRFITQKSLINQANDQLEDALAKFAFVLSDPYLRLKNRPVVCRAFQETSLTLDFYQKVYENYGTLTALESMDAKIQADLVASQKKIQAIAMEDTFTQKINKLTANFWTAVNERELKKAVNIGNSVDLYFVSIGNEIQNSALLETNTKDKLVKLADSAKTKLKADVVKELTLNKFRSRLQTRLDQVALDILDNVEAYNQREDYVLHLKPMLVGMLRFDEEMGFDLPLAKNWDEFFTLEDKVVQIEAAWLTFKSGKKQ